MTVLARSQILEMIERLDRFNAVLSAYAKGDEAGACAILDDVVRIKHRLHGWLHFTDEPATADEGAGPSR